MKKLFVIPIMFVYLLAISGIMVSIHYCGQQVESWNVFADHHGCEGADNSCSDKEDDGCCKDKVISVKISDDQSLTSVFKIKFTPAEFAMPATPQVFTSTPFHYNGVTAKAYMSNAPPGCWQYIPLYKLHSRFTYYG